MKVDMNGIRIDLARAYNGLFEDSPYEDNDHIEVSRDRLAKMCEMVGAFLCLYDDTNMRELSDDILLRNPYGGEWPLADED
jgi:hypothetical protein